MSASQGRSLSVSVERFALAAPFVISRGAKSVAEVVTVTLAEGLFQGRGECVPYGRFGETLAGVVAAVQAAVDAGAQVVGQKGMLVNKVVIPHPRPELLNEMI